MFNTHQKQSYMQNEGKIEIAPGWYKISSSKQKSDWFAFS